MSDNIDELLSLVGQISVELIERDKIVHEDCFKVFDEKLEETIDKWNDIGCTSFQFTSKKIKEILVRQKNEKVY